MHDGMKKDGKIVKNSKNPTLWSTKMNWVAKTQAYVLTYEKI